MSTWGQRGVPQHVRERVLERDGWRCQLGYPDCTVISAEVDDIIPVSVLGVSREECDDTNRQAVCHACHRIKTEAHRLDAARAAAARRYARRHLPVKPHPGEYPGP